MKLSNIPAIILATFYVLGCLLFRKEQVAQQKCTCYEPQHYINAEHELGCHKTK